MAAIAITYTFTNATTADATAVNQNFTDIINGLSDATKDISVNAVTAAGNLTVSGNTVLGNASSDDVTITGSLAASIPIKTTNSFDIGSSTLGLRALYFGANSQTVNIKASASMSATWTFTLPVTAGTSGYFLKTDGSGVSSWSAFTPPTIQTFTSGSGTYTTPANVKYIKVTVIGGGGGGGGSGTGGTGGNGGAGGASTFDTLTANGGGAGGGGAAAANGATGGTGVGGAGWTTIRLMLGNGGSANFVISAALSTFSGGNGGKGIHGGNGRGAYSNNSVDAPAVNSGGGGDGGAANTNTSGFTGAGGGAGGYIEAVRGTPSATYSYAVGAAGTSGSAGTGGLAGSTGGSGYIVVEEYYQ